MHYMAKYMFDLKKEYNAFLIERSKTPMDYRTGNDALYDMCEKHPYHTDIDVIVSKIWLIGRSYAASIERSKDAKIGEENTDSFYYDKVAPTIKKYSDELDGELDRIRQLKGDYKENVESILSLHKFLMKKFNSITQLQNRSLASKYLHFHCRDKFLIFDSRAQAAARKAIQRPDKPKDWVELYDPDYVDFVCRIIDMTDKIELETGDRLTPREVDNFLLHHIAQL